MSPEIDNLITRCVELREAGRIDEAILAARRATSVDSQSANAWWQLGLAVAQKDGDAAGLEYFKRTVELADYFGYGWYRLGNAYKSLSMLDEAIDAWENACLYEEDFERARYRLVDAYNSRKLIDEEDKLYEQLTELEARGKLRAYDYHLLAIRHHGKREYRIAIPYYESYLALRDDEYGFTNLSLAYSSPQVGQELDAADCCHIALNLNPDFEKAHKLLSVLRPKLEVVSSKVREDSEQSHLVPTSSWYEVYINPFELLQIRLDELTSDPGAKEVQKAKKTLLQEIELEDGHIEWMPHLKIDKSLAIRLSEELNDETLRSYHRRVYEWRPLLNFLSRGDITLFLHDCNAAPIDLITAKIRDKDFILWLSDFFSKQYDAVFNAALLNRNINVIEAILSGRRFVSPEYEDKCFATSIRQSAVLLNELTDLNERVEESKVALHQIRSALANRNLGRLLEILPPAFQDVQSEAAQTIRSIAVGTYNHHGDADLSKAILELGENLANKSPSFRVELERDKAKLDEIIASEKKYETKLRFGDTAFEITRDSFVYGKSSIKVVDVETLRWGVSITNASGGETYDFIIVVGGKGSQSIKVNWRASANTNEQNELFQKCIRAIYAYMLPTVVEKIKSQIDKGRTIYIGGLPITQTGITLKVRGWFSTKDEHCMWRSLVSEIENGSVNIRSSSNRKAEASLPLADIDNAWILHMLIKEGMMK